MMLGINTQEKKMKKERKKSQSHSQMLLLVEKENDKSFFMYHIDFSSHSLTHFASFFVCGFMSGVHQFVHMWAISSHLFYSPPYARLPHLVNCGKSDSHFIILSFFCSFHLPFGGCWIMIEGVMRFSLLGAHGST